jgi:hypothetical protein
MCVFLDENFNKNINSKKYISMVEMMRGWVTDNLDILSRAACGWKILFDGSVINCFTRL